jgi:hypothetical protein
MFKRRPNAESFKQRVGKLIPPPSWRRPILSLLLVALMLFSLYQLLGLLYRLAQLQALLEHQLK